MLRINHIIKILSSVKPYTPHTYKSKTDKIIDKMNGTLALFAALILFLLLIAISLYKLFEPFRCNLMICIIFGLYFIGTTIGIVIMLLPPISGMKYLINWKKETSNDLIFEISHDEENAKLLLEYSEKELLYSIYWLQMKINRINIRVSSFFGEKTAVLSVLALTYSAVQSSIGFDKLSHTFTQGLFSSGVVNTFIMFGLAFLLGLSLGALMLKKVANHQLYLKEIVELTLRLQKNAQDEEKTSV